MKRNVMTAEQAFNRSMNVYPSLYSSPSVELSKFKYFDHVFNTIGNGTRSLEEFVDRHTINKEDEDVITEYPEKYISEQPLFMVYKEFTMIGNHKSPKNGSDIDGLYTESEVAEMPDTYSTLQINKKYKWDEDKEFSPYPNFRKDYSMVWNIGVTTLDDSWTNAAIWYYEKAKKFFNSEHVSNYHGAYPKTEKNISRIVADYEKAFERYKTEEMTELEFHKTISDAYELEYNGNIQDFIQRRWNKELSRILNFIDETLVKLKS